MFIADLDGGKQIFSTQAWLRHEFRSFLYHIYQSPFILWDTYIGYQAFDPKPYDLMTAILGLVDSYLVVSLLIDVNLGLSYYDLKKPL